MATRSVIDAVCSTLNTLDEHPDAVLPWWLAEQLVELKRVYWARFSVLEGERG